MRPTPEIVKSELKEKLKSRWDIERDHWSPIDEPVTNEEVVYFPQHLFFEDFGIENLKRLISEFSEKVVFQWNWETSTEQFFTISIEEMVEFNNLEKYYFDDSLDWIVYISHENTIAFGGQELIERLIENWANWFKYLNKWE